jgi:hypothetical protein
VPFPLSDAVGDAVKSQLTADATTKQVTWYRGEVEYDRPDDVPFTDSFGDNVPLGYILVHETRVEPKFMGGQTSGPITQLSSWLGHVPVQVTLVIRSQTKDTQVARRKAEDMLNQVLRVVLGGDVSLGGLVMHVDNASARTDGIPKQGVAWATCLVEYRFIASAV